MKRHCADCVQQQGQPGSAGRHPALLPDIPFAAVVGSLPDVPLKPDPTALRDLLSELELDPADGLYVGDTVMDMQCANAVGIYAVGALWGFQSKEELEEANPAVLIEAVPDLMRVVKERFGV